ncbi:hypothetical protein [Dialister pneumosintes]|jgi:hypothetical protein|uniref:PEGA domain-containing protein n=1 Tax=Dialister pneumosintes TaxID=39950 RepID=A0ABX9MD50_9FIRM|nr:hypothetical protein [Dialister pneumosintes]MBS6480054.1 hypothetical protein [Dialister sp.]RID94228.1 hypothetical protein DX915_01430 [Dialister pneumosintes]
MKKVVLATSIALALVFPAMAAEPMTLTDRVDRLDEVVYGNVQSGSFIQRIRNLDKSVCGTTSEKDTTEGLDSRVEYLYAEVIRSENDENPSVDTRVNALEYYLTDQIKQAALTERLDDLDVMVLGKKQNNGGLIQRINVLEKAVYGDNHYELTTVTLPEKTVFKISLNEDISSKINRVGDPVHFTVEEDVLVDNVLVLPRGAQGSGVVTKVTRPKFFGRSGFVDISFDQVFSIDEEAIPTVLGPEAKEKLKMQAAAIGASAIGALALGPIGLVGGLFVKGKDVEMPAGTELYIQTREDVVTKGMEMKPGAPLDVDITIAPVVSKTIDDTEKDIKEDNSSVDEPKNNIVKDVKNDSMEETSTSDDDTASVVIVRNE